LILELNTKEKELLVSICCKAVACSTISPKEKEAIVKLKDKTLRSMGKIKPRSAKNKGASWQKEVCEIISEITGIPFNNTDDDCNIHSRTMGSNGTDVVLTGKARKLFPIGIECKNSNKISLPDWIKQAKANAIKGNYALFIKSKLLEDCVVCLPVSLFKKTYKTPETK
jgi:hypothetical protein